MVVARTVLPTMFMPMYMYTKNAFSWHSPQTLPCRTLRSYGTLDTCAVNGAPYSTDGSGLVEWFFRYTLKPYRLG